MLDPRPSQAERYETAGKILNWVGGKLLEDIGPDWARIDLKVSMAANVDDYQYATLNQDGSVRERELPADQLRRPFSDLREVLWEEEKGTWFSIRFTIDAPDNSQTEYNFEVDPVWDPPISPDVWAKDLEIFPRAEAWRPRWLQRELNPGVELPRVEPGGVPVNVMYSRHVGQQVKQTAPTGWTYAQVHFREIGDYAECTALVRDLTGRMFRWAPPQAVTERFREFRASMQGPQTTWCTARLDVEYTGREHLKFDRTAEPQWITPPPPEAYQEELRRAGSADVLPDWLRARLDELGD